MGRGKAGGSPDEESGESGGGDVRHWLVVTAARLADSKVQNLVGPEPRSVGLKVDVPNEDEQGPLSGALAGTLKTTPDSKVVPGTKLQAIEK